MKRRTLLLSPSKYPSNSFPEAGSSGGGDSCERTVTQWTTAIEFLVYVDGQFQESWKFHGQRLPEYPGELAKRRDWFLQDGWAGGQRRQTTTSPLRKRTRRAVYD